MLTVADCHRSIRLEFFLGTKPQRKRSLRKINLIISSLGRFRDALNAEADLIDQLERASKTKKTAKPKKDKK